MTKTTDDLHANSEVQVPPITEKVKAPRKKRQKRLHLDFSPDGHACVSNAIAFGQILQKKTGVITSSERGEILASICQQWLEISQAKYLVKTPDEAQDVTPSVSGDSAVEPAVSDNADSDEPVNEENNEESNPDDSQ